MCMRIYEWFMLYWLYKKEHHYDVQEPRQSLLFWFKSAVKSAVFLLKNNDIYWNVENKKAWFTKPFERLRKLLEAIHAPAGYYSYGS